MSARIIIVPTGKTGPSGSGGSTALDDLSDVTITAAAPGDILRHNGTAWVDTPGTTHFEAAGAVAAHEADTTNVHGIADTSALVTSSGLTTTLSSYLTTAAAPELIRDTIGTALTAGTGITVTPNDGADTITVASSITQYTDEMARDAIGTALVAGSNVTITVNDGSDTITVASSAGFPTPSLIDPANHASIPGAVFTGGSTMAWGKDNMFLQAIYVPATVTVSAMQVRITSAGDAGTVARLGIFQTTSALAGGGNRVLDAGTVAIDTTGVKTITGLSQQLTAGWYFLVMVHNSTTTPTWVHYLYQNAVHGLLWKGHDTGTPPVDYINNTFTYAALNATAPASPTITYGGGYGARAFIFLRWT